MKLPLRAAGKPWGCPPNPHLPLRAAGGYFCTPKVTKSAGGFDSPGPHKRPLRGVGNALKQKQNPGSRKLLAIWVFLRSISAPGRVGEGGTGGRIETSPGFSFGSFLKGERNKKVRSVASKAGCGVSPRIYSESSICSTA